jgi:hypothetical protein
VATARARRVTQWTAETAWTGSVRSRAVSPTLGR